jgi:AAA15 family ATPase/GTPase
MAMLNKIHIQNYRIHKDTKIFVGAKKIGNFLVLVGKNDIGKTSVLKALDIFFNERIVCDNDLYQDKQDIIIECTFGDKLIQRTIKYGNFTPDTLLCQKELPKFAFFDIVNQYDYSEIANYTIDDIIMVVENQISRFIQYNKDESFYDESIESFAEEDEMAALLIQWKDLLEDFNEYNKNITIESRGAGVQRICALYFHIMQSIMKSNVAEYIFAIDEPELSLHPEQQRKLIKILRNVSNQFQNIQIIIATHSPFIVNEVKYKEVFVLNHKTKKDKKGNVVELPEIGANSLKPRVFKNYNSMAEINYLAFDEGSKDYHIELFGYIQNRLSYNYRHDSTFRSDWNNLQRHDKFDRNGCPLSASGIIDSVVAVDNWLVNFNHITNFNTNLECNNKWYNTDTLDIELRSLPHCVRNNIDHPLISCPSGHNINDFRKAKKNNAKYDNDNIIKDSIRILRKAIIDNNL